MVPLRRRTSQVCQAFLNGQTSFRPGESRPTEGQGTPRIVRYVRANLRLEEHRAALTGAPSALGVTVTAIDGLAGSRLEGNLGIFATGGTHRGKERTLSRCGALALPARSPGSAAVLAARRLMLKSLLGVKGLLTRREEKLLPALPARQHLILKFHPRPLSQRSGVPRRLGPAAMLASHLLQRASPEAEAISEPVDPRGRPSAPATGRLRGKTRSDTERLKGRGVRRNT